MANINRKLFKQNSAKKVLISFLKLIDDEFDDDDNDELYKCFAVDGDDNEDDFNVDDDNF